MVVRTRVWWRPPPQWESGSAKWGTVTVQRIQVATVGVGGRSKCSFGKVSHVGPWLFMVGAPQCSACQVTARTRTLAALEIQDQAITSGHTGLNVTGNSRIHLSALLHMCNIWPSVFWYFWSWLSSSDVSRLNSIKKKKKSAWLIESWQPSKEPDARAGKYGYRKIAENTCLLIFGVDLSLRIIFSLWLGKTAEGFQHK